MGRPKKERAPLPPIWRTPDELWGEVEPILAELDPPKQGPKRIDQRAALDAMIFRVRSGLPVEPAAQGVPGRQLGPSDAAALDRPGGVRADLGGGPGGVRGPGRVRLGVAGGRWRAAEGPFGGELVGPNPTDRAKPGVKQSLLVEADGGPLAITIAGANVPDAQLLQATIDAIVLERPEPEPDFPQHLCLDKGYDNDTGWESRHRRRLRPPHRDDPRPAPARPSGTKPAGGWWNGRWPGSPSVVACSSATRRRPRTTSASSSSPAASSGPDATSGSPVRDSY